jgi:hypothetical protein
MNERPDGGDRYDREKDHRPENQPAMSLPWRTSLSPASRVEQVAIHLAQLLLKAEMKRKKAHLEK